MTIPNFDSLFKNLDRRDAIRNLPDDPNSFYFQKFKHSFVFRQKYFLAKIQISGTIVFMISKDRHIFGIDDGTEVNPYVLKR